MHLREAHSMWLKRGIPFVSFRYPRYTEIKTLVGGAFTSVFPVGNSAFFVFAPFDDKTDDLLYFLPEYDFSDVTIPDFSWEKPATYDKHETQRQAVVANHDEYLDQANQLIQSMQQHQLQKVVLSRIIAKPLQQRELPQVFEALCRKYANAFVYLFSDGNGLCWLGASPEVLLAYEHGTCETMALAGTQRMSSNSVDVLKWGAKEMEEQEIVTDFIKDVLIENGVKEFVIKGPETSVAGHLAHLRTSFSWSGSFDASYEIARQLHPTPAVCGLPRAEALTLIKGTELHSRAYYTGYLGYVLPQKSIKLFVNLRCLQHTGDIACIYAGGGLTAASIAGHEWQETEAKAETLLSVFPNNSATLRHDSR